MKTTNLIIASMVLSFAAAGAAYADGNSPRSGFNKGSQYNIEWLTRTTNNRSDVDSSSQPPVITRQPDSKPMFGGYRQHNHNGSVTENKTESE